MKNSGKYQIDMCHGPLLKKIIIFAVPLMIANIASLMFTAADLIVLGHFSSSSAMAAVGAAPAFTTLLLNLFWGVSSGVNVLVARYIGAKDKINLSRTIHTAAAVGCFGGIFTALVGIIATIPVLRMMAVPENIMSQAALYMRLWCIGIPFMILFSFGSAILRSKGDTKRPFVIMIISGIVNVLLNLFFVIVCKMSVTGVGIATTISNALSGLLAIRVLSISGDDCKIYWKKIGFSLPILKEMLRIGIPAGVQGALFSVSNIIIQSTLNSFGWQAIAGSTAALNIEGLVHASFGAFSLAAVSFVSQNHGAKKYKRIMKSIRLCLGITIVMTIVMITVIMMFKRPLLGLFNPDPEVIEWGCVRMDYQFTFYTLLGLMEIITGVLRGLGYSFRPTVVTLLGACVFRVIWVFTIFPHFKTLQNLMISYPVSWLIVTSINGFMLYCICRRMLKNASLRKFDDLSVK